MGKCCCYCCLLFAQAGAIVVGIIDKLGGLIKQEGFSFQEIKSLLLNRSSNFLETKT